MEQSPQPGSAEAMPSVSGELRLGPYLLGAKLGEGGMGIVYRGHDQALARDVAIKVLNVPRPASQRLIQRFTREAQAAARLNHPNVVTIYHFGQTEGQLYLVMELIEDGSLADHLSRHGRMSWRDATAAIRDAACGLQAAHEAGLVHRDVKPSNLMRARRGTIKVVDFGLARVRGAETAITQPGMLVGTPEFMSPEQCGLDEIDRRSDLYSLLCTYYALLTRRPPFTGADVAEVLRGHLREPLPDPRLLVPELPEGVWQALEHGARKRPAERFQNAAELIAALDELLASNGRRASIARGAKIAIRAALTESIGVAVGEVASGALPPNNLPAEVNSFIGRAAESSEAARLLGGARLLTLLGPGGTGKTRLSLHVAARVAADYPDGVWLVELAALTDPTLVPQAVAAAAAVREQPNRAIVESLVDALRSRRTLLVLDNCEHLVAAAANLAETVLRACPSVRVLATSREALGIAGEATMPVPPLTLPAMADDANRPPTAQDVAAFEAVKLFVERATAANARFRLTDDNAPHVARIVVRLDGIPLAIELAAARVTLLSPEQIAARLGDRFRLLTGGSRTALPRQKALRALIDWSHELLDEPERTLFRRLAVFAGGWTLELAERICAAAPLDSSAVLDLLSNLVNKSLVVADPSPSHPRFRMLESIRDYAAEKLAAAGEAEATRTGHRDAMIEFAGEVESLMTGPQQGEAMDRLDAETENVRAALDCCAATADGVALMLRLAASLGRYWYLRGRLREGTDRLTQALALPGNAEPPTPVRAKALNYLGVIQFYLGHRTRSQELHEQSLRVARACNDSREIAMALNNLGNTAHERADYAGATAFYSQSLEIRRHLGDKWALAGSINNLARLAIRRGEVDRSIALFNEALALRRETGDRGGIGYGLYNLGETHMTAGNLALGRQFYEQALAVLDELRDEWGVAYVLQGMGRALTFSDDPASARAMFDKAGPMLRKLGDEAGLAGFEQDLGAMELRLGNLDAARPLLRQSLAAYHGFNDPLGTAWLLEEMALLLRAEGRDPARAAKILAAAAAMRERLQTPVLPLYRPRIDEATTTLRATLGDAAFDAAWAEGQALSTDAAVTLALHET